MEIIIYSLIGLSLGALSGWLFYRYWTRSLIKNAKSEAEEILDEVKEQLEIKQIEQNEKLNEIEMELWTKSEPELLRLENKVTDLDERFQEKKSVIDNRWSQKKSENEAKHQLIRSKEIENKKLNMLMQDKKFLIKKEEKGLIEQLSKKMNTSTDDVKKAISETFIAEIKRQINKEIENYESDVKEKQEEIAKKMLDTVLDRFARSYCPERGIAAVYFPDNQSRHFLCDTKGFNLKLIQDLCGCDILVEDNNDLVGIAGFDPVRRELTRRVIERIFKERRPATEDSIKKTVDIQKRELFRQIKQDGDAIVKELKLENVHPEIRQMMGSLRFRYSFTQNQYFHCAEVGWLCGMLSSEVNVNLKAGRRSGMLHDIGKSMDHAMDGGHAVIGANFIALRGEQADIVHNVKAHHYDEQPNSVHAFLVIAADAISGARPGARRSTLETYAQKISELQDIARSFDGVTDCFVLNGGRECRVYVNNKKVNDRDALSLSQKIATRIESECNYPGQIKVVVVRETIVHEQTTGKPPREKFREEENA
ncbi:MAG: Rnase Y domain-containing protein [Bdellovibrionaceae bacterium]|nr:Rnase Y domain-containing protein [Pseudobdellovibrionaceae bacterium]